VLALLAGCTGDSTAPPAEPLVISPASSVLLPGETVQLVAQGRSADVEWRSSAPQVASVVAVTGFVTAVAPGQAIITLESGGRTATATIRVLEPARIELSATRADFQALDRGPDPDPVTLQVTNGGEADLTGLSVQSVSYGTGQPTGWLTATLDRATAPATLTLTASRAGFPAGDYTATVEVGSPVASQGPGLVEVAFRVVQGAEIVLSTGAVELSAEPGGSSSAVTVQVTNPGEQALTGLSTRVEYSPGGPTGWLTAALDRIEAPAVLSLTGSGLDPGTYSATVEVSSAVSGVDPREVQVSFLVSRVAAIGLSRTTVDFAGEEGGSDPGPQTVQVSNAGGGVLDDLRLDGITYGAGEPTGWLQASLSGAAAPATLTLTPDISGLAEGSYAATVTVASELATNSPRTVEVSLTLTGVPVLGLSTTTLSFQAVRGSGDPGSQAVQITNEGGGTLSGLQGLVFYDPGPTGWIEGTFTSSSAPSAMVIQPRTAGLEAGEYRATVRVSSATDSRVVPREVQVVLQVDLSFDLDVFPIFDTDYTGFARCTGCHVNGGTAPRLDERTAAYQALLGGGLVVPGNPDGSELVCRIEGTACGDAMPLPAQQIAIIRAWIEQGASR
jgi:hypothetical protein